MDHRANGCARDPAVTPSTDLVNPWLRLGARWRGRCGRAGVLLALGLLLLPAAVGAQPVGEGSCLGENACGGNTGPVGNDACIGFEACAFNEGPVRDDACLGTDACALNTGPIKDHSCVGVIACTSNTGPVKDHSCLGDVACAGNTGPIKENSCLGLSACQGNTGAVGNGACVGTEACAFNSGDIGPGQCLLLRVGPAAWARLDQPALLQAMRPRLHRALGDAQALGDLGDFEPLVPECDEFRLGLQGVFLL
jgi:hypothetical protein